MNFVREASAAVILATLTLSLQCGGMAAVIAWARPSFARGVLKLGAIRSAMLMMRFMTAFIVLHIFEILLWAAFYRWRCFPVWESAFYFSAASYATVGYGDVVLPRVWRTLGPVESIIGVLMCGLSVSFLFAIVSRLVVRAALEDAAYEHLVGRGHRDRLARLDDLNSLALIRHDAGQLFKLPKAVAQRVN
jgi:voltage-gated potassium channel